MSCFDCSHGKNSEPISYWCNKNCWEAKGMSSRFIEQYMKGIKAVGRLSDCFPLDFQDFERCIDILNKYPEWIPRLTEFYRLKGFTNWKRLVRSWDMFVMLYNDLPLNKPYKLFTERDKQKIKYFSYLLQGITTDHGLLLNYKLKINDNESFIFKLENYFVVGSLVLQEKNQDDEYDLYTCFVIDVFPENMSCEKYNESGKIIGTVTANSYLPQNIKNNIENTDDFETTTETLTNLENKFVKIIDDEIKSEVIADPPKCTFRFKRYPDVDTPYFRSQELVKKLHTKMTNYIAMNSSTWQTTNYHFCPHYKIYANSETDENTTDDQFEMFYADVFPLVETAECWKLGACIISITNKHKLHPLNKNNEFEVIYNNEKWIISSAPIKLYTYYEEGLINAVGDEQPESITDKEIEFAIKKNIIENIKLEKREKDINENTSKNPVQKVGILNITCN